MSSSSDSFLFTEEYYEKLAKIEATRDLYTHVAAYVEKQLTKKKASCGAN
jgi:hypothetical protein